MMNNMKKTESKNFAVEAFVILPFGLVSSRGSSKKFAGKILLGNNMNNLWKKNQKYL